MANRTPAHEDRRRSGCWDEFELVHLRRSTRTARSHRHSLALGLQQRRVAGALGLDADVEVVQDDAGHLQDMALADPHSASLRGRAEMAPITVTTVPSSDCNEYKKEPLAPQTPPCIPASGSPPPLNTPTRRIHALELISHSCGRERSVGRLMW
jgi:hypothetical protein